MMIINRDFYFILFFLIKRKFKYLIYKEVYEVNFIFRKIKYIALSKVSIKSSIRLQSFMKAGSFELYLKKMASLDKAQKKNCEKKI